ncbi:MAG: cytochrome c nitrite reductase small subunit [Helicobacteraceae bacterium]|nr:cytochrome c nitrite reductase small subunit [Helicobacteraceae bacterium]
MGRRKLLVVSAIFALLVVIGMFSYVLSASKAFTYLSDDPKACINCHVMNTQYATWQHSAHGVADVKCNSCHLPEGGIGKLIAKAKDGFNHSKAFTFGGYGQAITMSKDGARRVQENCVTCHASLARVVIFDAKLNGDAHKFDSSTATGDRYCWSCHRETPHGKARGLASVPNNLGVREVK